MKTQYLCLPLMRPTTTTTTATTTSTSSSPANRRVVRQQATTLMDRFRETVFRLIMATALSKKTNNNSNNNNNNNNSSSSRSSTAEYYDYHNQSVRSSYYIHDPYPSEAVADCIEFIKRKSMPSTSSHLVQHDHDDDDQIEHSTRDSTASSEVVIPLPVM